jgi:tetratricopeptide (TPR) repeat protein
VRPDPSTGGTDRGARRARRAGCARAGRAPRRRRVLGYTRRPGRGARRRCPTIPVSILALALVLAGPATPAPAPDTSASPRATAPASRPAAPADSARGSRPGRLLVPGRPAPVDTAALSRTRRARREYDEGLRLEGIHSYAAAITSYSLAVRDDPTIKDAHYRMGALYARVGALREAVGEFSAEIEQHPENLAAARELGLALSQVGEHRRAVRQLRLLTQRLPNDGASWRALGFAYVQAGRTAEAEQALRRAIALPPAAALEHRDLGHLLATTGRQVEARQEYQRALALDPSEPGTWINLGNLERADGNLPAALADFDQAVKRDSTVALAWKGRAQVLFEQRHMRESAEAYRRVLDLVPADEESRMLAIRLYAGLERADVALELARDGVRAYPRSGGARLMLGMALEAGNDLRGATTELRRAEGLSADSTTRVRARAMIDALGRRAPPALRADLEADSAKVAAELAALRAPRDSVRGVLRHDSAQPDSAR